MAISNESGQIVEKRQFDAWGSLIKLEQNGVLQLTINNSSLTIDRGYTGHEHLLSVGLINMNGRIYDPVLHRFLQPDNFVQDPTNTQNYNRYGYVLNNPLAYIDESGENYNCPTCPEGYGNGGGNNGFEGGYQGQGAANIFKSVADFFKNPENAAWFRKNAGEIGRFIGRNVESAVSDIGKGLESAGQFLGNNLESLGKDIGNFFKGIFGGGGSSGPPPVYVAQQTNFNSNSFQSRQDVIDYYSNFDYTNDEPQFYTTYETRFEALASFFQIIGPEVPASIAKSISNLFSSTAKGGVTVVGETMDRVVGAASKIPGSKILNTMPKYTGTANQITSQMMTYNRQWILQQMRSGRTIFDIGLDATRANRSIFYQMEQNMMKNYQILHPNSLKIIKP